MKRFSGILALTVIMILGGQSVIAQNIKFAHINSDELIQALPEYDTAMTRLEKTRTELVNTLELMSVELNNKLDEGEKLHVSIIRFVSGRFGPKSKEMKDFKATGEM